MQIPQSYGLLCKTKLIFMFELLIMNLMELVITNYYLYHKYYIFCD